MGRPLSRYEHVYVQAQPVGTHATIPNSGGTASVAAADAIKTRGSITLNYNKPRIDSPDKQDNETFATIDTSVEGRGSGDWSLSLALRGSSAAGTPPDSHALLLAALGKYTNNAGVSCVYELNLDTYPLGVVLWRFVQEFAGAGKVLQEVGFGAFVKTMKLAFGQDFATLDFAGPMLWGLSNDQWASADTTMKGGLTSDPFTEPASQTYTGSLLSGLQGSATINGVTYVDLIKSGGADMDFGRAYDMGIFGTGYGGDPSDDKFDIRPYFTIVEEDSAAQAALRAAAIARTPIDITFVNGIVAGAIYTWLFKNVILDYKPERSDGGRHWQQTFRGKAHSTNLTTRDEVKLTIT